MSLLLVRHADAGKRSAYQGDDRERPLSKRGLAQAVALVPVLIEYEPQRILSSPFVRCLETVRPTAEASSLPVEALDQLAEGHEADTVRLVRKMAGEPVVLCTHGDGAIAVLEWLVEVGGARKRQPRLQKGDVWVIANKGSSPAIVDHIRLSKRAPG